MINYLTLTPRWKGTITSSSAWRISSGGWTSAMLEHTERKSRLTVMLQQHSHCDYSFPFKRYFITISRVTVTCNLYNYFIKFVFVVTKYKINMLRNSFDNSLNKIEYEIDNNNYSINFKMTCLYFLMKKV